MLEKCQKVEKSHFRRFFIVNCKKKYDRYDSMRFVRVQHIPWGDFERIMDTITMLEKKKPPFYLPRSKMTVF